MNKSEALIKIKARFSKQFFPKNNEPIADGGFGIISWVVEDVIDGDPEVHPFFKTLTIKGNMFNPDRSEVYTIVAKEQPDDKFGMQYELMYIGVPIDLSSSEKQRAFLKQILTAKQTEALFGVYDKPIDLIKNNQIDELIKVKGIGEATANRIIEKYYKHEDFAEAYIELDQFGLTHKMVQKLVGVYGSPNVAISKIKTNPYLLATEVKGIGFLKADEMALNGGMAHDSPNRVKGFILHTLQDEAEKGNSYLLSNDIMYLIEDALGFLESSLIGESVNELVEEGRIGLDEDESGYKKIYLNRYKALENSVAGEVVRLLKGENNFEYGNWEQKVKELEARQGWEHTKEQWDGIKTVLENQVTVITGNAGSGKSTVVAGMLEALNVLSGKYTFAQTALAGKAAAKLQEITGKDGLTIHRLLGFDKEKGGFAHDRGNPLKHDIIILDEISLVGGEIFLNLIKAIKTGSKLILIGDDGQLESIGCMNLAKDLIESEEVPLVRLTKTHRQAQKSAIVTEALKVRHHEQLCDRGYEGTEVRGELQDFELCVRKDKEQNKQLIIDYFKEWLPKVDSIMDLQVIVPVNERGDCSVEGLNTELQNIYNPRKKGVKELKIVTNKKENKHFYLRIGDKILILKNNYKTVNTEGKEAPIFNGWSGLVEDVDEEKRGLIVYFPVIDERVVLKSGDLMELQLGYASTCHKNQGSQYEVVIGNIDYSTPPFMRTRELVYTMITRAIKYCVLVAQNGALQECINSSGVSQKNTFLKELIKEQYKNS